MDPGLALQTGLNRFGASLIVDGVIGSKTLLALESLSPVDSAWLDFELFQEIGMGARRAATGERGFATPGYVFLRKSDCEDLVERACKMLGMSDYEDTFKDFLRLEAAQQRIDGDLCYNVLSKNGSSRGLTQFQPKAWVDAREKALSVSRKLDIGSYADNVYFPANNIIACIAYSMVAIQLMEEKYGIPVNGETMYLSHNQGPNFWANLSGVNVRRQSAAARQIIVKYQRMRENGEI